MATPPVDTELTRIALGKIQGFPFEAFVNDYFAALLGKEFVPLGGVKDGGADGFEMFVSADSSQLAFIQASIRMDVQDKVRDTIRRLRQVERQPSSLMYVSSKPIKSLDIIEEQLTAELDVTIRIRDANYISSHVNDNTGTRTAYCKHLEPLLEPLKHIGSSTVVDSSAHVKDPTVFVFLAQELDRRGGDHNLVADVVDSLVLWSLEETDPDLNLFMSEDEILAKILGVLPSVEHLVKPRLTKRLNTLSSKTRPDGRAIKNYRKEKKYCLPYETRRLLREENEEDEALRVDVETSIEERFQAIPHEGIGDVGATKIVKAVIRALQLTFEKQGLSFVSSLQSGDPTKLVVVTDALSMALDESGMTGKSRTQSGDIAFECLRGVIYNSTHAERDYLHKLSRTYVLLFTLNTEPKLIDFFQRMAGDFYLYVGSDQLIKALSETYLEEADQVYTNTLKMAAETGARLILTEPVLDEVVHHLKISDFEFKNTFAEIENSVSFDLARNSPKILVRAYMYARYSRHRDSVNLNWPSFINQFCTYSDLHRDVAFTSIRRFLQNKFSMEYKDRSDLRDRVDSQQLASLSQRLQEEGGKKPELAENDALMVLSVYKHRRRNHESSSPSEYGFQTWWLTDESKVLKYTQELVGANGATNYIMRPEFLLNFLTLAPAAAKARESFSLIFPSLLGVSLSRRMNESTFRQMISKVSDAEQLNEPRRMAAMAEYSDRLKSDLRRQYMSISDENESLFIGVDAVMNRYEESDIL